MSDVYEYLCGPCKEDDHSNHQLHLAGICIGCPCGWLPNEDEEE